MKKAIGTKVRFSVNFKKLTGIITDSWKEERLTVFRVRLDSPHFDGDKEVLEMVVDGFDLTTVKSDAERAKDALARRQKDSALRSIGLKKVKGALGGTYWE